MSAIRGRRGHLTAATSRRVEIGRGAARNDRTDPYIGGVEAAFFDLDKTVIAKASIMAFAGDFRREGLLTRRTMAKGLWTQLVYVHIGASSKKMARIRRSVLSVSRGWDQGQIRQVVVDKLTAAIDPITYAEARDLIDEHLGAGHRVYLVSAAPAEIVEPLARHFGAHRAVASIAEVGVDGRYTGQLEQYAYGAEKARLVQELAARDGLDLDASYAYSDSVSDVPMLEVVGHPVAVNPDRALRRVAGARGWEVRHFDRMLRAEPLVEDTADAAPALGGRTRLGSASWARRGRAAAAVAAAAGGAGAVAWRYRSQLGST
jgi:HAD superfamily hydrolase (TIGR01490 family)